MEGEIDASILAFPTPHVKVRATSVDWRLMTDD
jgi:hypothetical protein